MDILPLSPNFRLLSHTLNAVSYDYEVVVRGALFLGLWNWYHLVEVILSKQGRDASTDGVLTSCYGFLLNVVMSTDDPSIVFSG